MRLFLLTILCLSTILTSCGNKQLTQEELSDKLSKDWCDCVKKQSEGKTTEEILQISVNCIASVMLGYTQDKQLYDNMRMLIAAKGYDDTLSDYEKERLFGKELGRHLMGNAIDNCVVYRQALLEFKKYYIEKAKQDAGLEDIIEINEFINNMQAQLDELDMSQVNNLQTREQISNYYTMLGLLYEYTGKYTIAVKQYDKAILIDPESVAVDFKKLLVDYDNK
jgi:tetratricopeptide (TPR) repeat protein